MSTPSSTDQVQPGQVPPTQVAPPPPPEPSPAATPEGDDFIRVNRKELSNEIDRLIKEEAEFARIWGSKLGDHAAKRYKPEVEARDNRITALSRELRRRDIAAMDPKEIEKQFEEDPNFALEYAELVHTKPYEPPVYPADETPVIAQAWQQIRQTTLAAGLPEAKWQEIEQKAIEGEYQGAPDEHWSTTLINVQADITKELLAHAKTVDPASTINPNLLKDGPDATLGTRGVTSATSLPRTLSEFKKLSNEEQRAIIRQDGGQEHVDSLLRESR